MNSEHTGVTTMTKQTTVEIRSGDVVETEEGFIGTVTYTMRLSGNGTLFTIESLDGLYKTVEAREFEIVNVWEYNDFSEVDDAPAASEPAPVDGCMRPCANCSGSGTAEYGGITFFCRVCGGTGIHTEPEASEPTPEAPRAVDLLKDFDDAIVRTNILTEMERDLFPARWEAPEVPTSGESDKLTPDEILAVAVNSIRYQVSPANPAKFADHVQDAINTLRAENARLRAAMERIARNRDTYEDITKIAREALMNATKGGSND